VLITAKCIRVIYVEIRNVLTIFVSVFSLVLASFIVFKAKGEGIFRDRERGEEGVVVGLTGLFIGIDFNLQ
jgi:hypothetical protein